MLGFVGALTQLLYVTWQLVLQESLHLCNKCTAMSETCHNNWSFYAAQDLSHIGVVIYTLTHFNQTETKTLRITLKKEDLKSGNLSLATFKPA